MPVDPALVMQAPGLEGAGTHVLVIGIGTYDYLVDGALEDPEVADGMCQLPAAARSARRVASWILDEFDNPDRPLASLALVLSEPAPALFEHPRRTTPLVTSPTGEVESVAEAVAEWMARASTDRGNLAVLYFVGHGLHAGTSILLCRDYGKSKARRFEYCVNLDDLRVALASMQPDDQLLLVDACRNPDLVDQTLARGGSVGRALIAPEPIEDRGGTEAGLSVHFATSVYTSAWADDEGETLFSEALIGALSGGGALPHKGWRVATGGLQEALEAYLSRSAEDAGVEQVPQRGYASSFVICRPRELKVPVYVTCAPETVWTGPMRLDVAGPGSSLSLSHDPASASREWRLSLAKESYEFSVSFDVPGEYEGASVRETVVPPLVPVDLKLARRERRQ